VATGSASRLVAPHAAACGVPAPHAAACGVPAPHAAACGVPAPTGRPRGGVSPTTDTIDFEVILDGEVWLELDDGVEVHLRPGDTVVQNGTRHAWRNHGDAPCRLAVFIVGAHDDSVSRPG
jgi:hypothetical protein